MSQKQQREVPIPLHVRIALAGASNMSAACCTNPVDVIKTRMQIHREHMQAAQSEGAGFLPSARRIITHEGVKGLYKGLEASLLREGSYSAIRLGLYEPIKDVFGAQDREHAPLYLKIAAGATSGMLGSSIATPADLVKVRLQADQSGRQNVVSMFRQIYQHEGGIRGLYQGMGPNVQRAALLTASQVGTYDHAKHTLLNAGWFTEGLGLHAAASMVAGVAAALVTSPIDLIKTRLMNQAAASRAASGAPARVYDGVLDCAVKTVQREGVLALWAGFTAQWVRIGPHTIVTFMVFEELRALCGYAPM
jgi:hypothetical protein